MRFDERREPEFLRNAEILFQFRATKQRTDQQHRRGTEFPRLVDQIRIHRKILANTGEGNRSRNLAEIAVIPEEPLGLGQHRDAGRAGRLIGLRNLRIGEVLGNHALRRGGLLDLRNHRKSRFPKRRFKGKAAERRSVFQPTLQFRERKTPLLFFHPLQGMCRERV